MQPQKGSWPVVENHWLTWLQHSLRKLLVPHTWKNSKTSQKQPSLWRTYTLIQLFLHSYVSIVSDKYKCEWRKSPLHIQSTATTAMVVLICKGETMWWEFYQLGWDISRKEVWLSSAWDRAKKVKERLTGNDHSRGLTQAPFCLELSSLIYSLSVTRPCSPCSLWSADSSRDLRDGSGADLTEGDRRLLKGQYQREKTCLDSCCFSLHFLLTQRSSQES